jgi:hypothetical protein
MHLRYGRLHPASIRPHFPITKWTTITVTRAPVNGGSWRTATLGSSNQTSVRPILTNSLRQATRGLAKRTLPILLDNAIHLRPHRSMRRLGAHHNAPARPWSSKPHRSSCAGGQSGPLASRYRILVKCDGRPILGLHYRLRSGRQRWPS